MNGEGTREELQRIRRVSDMLCTAHAGLRDRYSRLALFLDLSLLGLSTWLVALAFVEPRIGVSLTPLGIDSQIWGGLLATFTFFLTIVQMKTDWKGRSDAHRRTLDLYAEVKREAGYLLASGAFDDAAVRQDPGPLRHRLCGWHSGTGTRFPPPEETTSRQGRTEQTA